MVVVASRESPLLAYPPWPTASPAMASTRSEATTMSPETPGRWRRMVRKMPPNPRSTQDSLLDLLRIVYSGCHLIATEASF